MRILINAITARLGGAQTHLINLLDNLPGDFSGSIYVVAPRSLVLPQHPCVHEIHVEWAVRHPLLRIVWERAGLKNLLRQLKIDVLFYPSCIVHYFPRHCKLVTMFRNMVPFDMVQRKKSPLGYRRLRNWLLYHKMLESMLRSDLVIFVSEFGREEVEKSAGRRLPNAVVIPHGISPNFFRANTELPMPSDWLPATGYLLYVSSIELYKAHINVVKAYSLLKQKKDVGEKLVFIGAELSDFAPIRNEIERLGLSNDVIWKSSVPHADLAPIYHNARVIIFASELENCPNILLESMAAGRPIACSNRPPMPEFGGDAVEYFDPARPEDLAEKLKLLMENPDYADRLSLKARQRATTYSWIKTSSATWSAIASLARTD